jgi:hypothetical protein
MLDAGLSAEAAESRASPSATNCRIESHSFASIFKSKYIVLHYSDGIFDVRGERGGRGEVGKGEESNTEQSYGGWCLKQIELVCGVQVDGGNEEKERRRDNKL